MKVILSIVKTSIKCTRLTHKDGNPPWEIFVLSYFQTISPCVFWKYDQLWCVYSWHKADYSRTSWHNSHSHKDIASEHLESSSEKTEPLSLNAPMSKERMFYYYTCIGEAVLPLPNNGLNHINKIKDKHVLKWHRRYHHQIHSWW